MVGAFLVILQTLAGGYVVWYVLGSIVSKCTFRYRVFSKREIVHPEELPAAARDYFASVAPHLAAEGFIVCAYIKQTGAVAGVKAFIAVWVNRQRGQSANLFVVVPAIGFAKLSSEFETVSGTSCDVVITNNNDRDVGVFSPASWLHTAYLPWAMSVAELYEIHLYRERRFLDHNVRYLVSDQSLLEASGNQAALVMREEARAGLMYETSTSGVFKYTWRGAFLTIFRIIPPVKQIRIWLKRRATRLEYLDAKKHIPMTRPTNIELTDQSPFEPVLNPKELTYQ